MNGSECDASRFVSVCPLEEGGVWSVFGQEPFAASSFRPMFILGSSPRTGCRSLTTFPHTRLFELCVWPTCTQKQEASPAPVPDGSCCSLCPLGSLCVLHPCDPDFGTTGPGVLIKCTKPGNITTVQLRYYNWFRCKTQKLPPGSR